MDVDLSRLPTGNAAWLALVDHALALGDLAELDYIEFKSEVPFADRAHRKASAVTLARAVLGLSNRQPDVARRHLGGYGVVLVGVQGHTVVGAERVDGAVLHDALQPYVGDDGPRWDYNYIQHPRGLVLALVVDPPQWGDPIHVCRKDFQSADGRLVVRDGDVFVRVPGKTRRSKSVDIVDLQRRRDRSPMQGVQIGVEYSDTFDHVDTASVIAIVASGIDRKADELLDGLRVRRSDPMYGAKIAATLASLSGDSRSPRDFKAAVERWRAEAHEKAPEVAEDFYRYELARGRWTLRNESDRYLESVRIQVQFPPGVRVLAESDAGYCEHKHGFDFMGLLDDPPEEWGSSSFPGIAMPRALDLHRNLLPARSHPFEVTADESGAVVTWHAGDLRPRSAEVGLDDTFAIVTDDHYSELTAGWRVTAKAVDHVFAGQCTIRCAQVNHERLSWRPRHR
jgi:hypothetical protein